MPSVDDHYPNAINKDFIHCIWSFLIFSASFGNEIAKWDTEVNRGSFGIFYKFEKFMIALYIEIIRFIMCICIGIVGTLAGILLICIFFVTLGGPLWIFLYLTNRRYRVIPQNEVVE